MIESEEFLSLHNMLHGYRHDPTLKPGNLGLVHFPHFTCRLSKVLYANQDLLIADHLPENFKVLTQNMRKRDEDGSLTKNAMWIMQDPEHRGISWLVKDGESRGWFGKCSHWRSRGNRVYQVELYTPRG